MKKSLCASLAIFLMTLLALAQAPPIPAPPATAKRPVTDEYHGVKVTDDYRWLEEIEPGTDVFGFLFEQLGIKYAPVAK